MKGYHSPLQSRYASEEMQYLFSPENKFRTWRLLWVILAEAERELGLNITEEQIADLKKYVDNINYDVAEEREKEVRHDVMAHVYAYGVQATIAKGIIHLGATSCYVTDNTDLIVMHEALKLIQTKVTSIIYKLKEFALTYKDLPTLGFTHFQAAQLTTVGKRATLWIHELMLDLQQIENQLNQAYLLGSKGTTGTQESFLSLFDQDHEKVKELDEKIAKKLGYQGVYPVSGQTYSRKIDDQYLNVLKGIAVSSHKFANDLRLLQSLKEIEEPFEKYQIGSSAMAYKRNPMRSERMTGLARFVITNSQNASLTAAEQWFERTLDDSSNKRLAVSECFLATDAILNVFLNIVDGLVVYPQVIEKHVQEELPFMVTETILMKAVKKGGDRQELHEKIRQYSMQAASEVKNEGKRNRLLEMILADASFGLNKEELGLILESKNFIGRAKEQTEEYITEIVEKKLSEFPEILHGYQLKV